VLRLRFFRILLPVLLILLVVMVWKSWVPRTGSSREPAETGGQDFPRGTGINFHEFTGSGRSISGQVELFEPGEDERLHLEGIRKLLIERDDGGPLIIRAVRGDREGKGNERVWRFEEEVVFNEEEKGVLLRLPSLVIDEEAGEARSDGEVLFEGPNMEGRASSLLYGLQGQPGELTFPEIEDERGGSMSADRAILLDGVRDVELLGAVKVVQPGAHLETERLHLVRGEDDQLERAEADGGVTGGFLVEEGPHAELKSDALDLRWDDEGEVASFRLTGEALLVRGDETLSADSIEAEREGGASTPWQIGAEKRVLVQGRFGGAQGLLRSDSLDATLDPSLNLVKAEAVGRVTFESRDTRSEAERATFEAGDPEGTIHLFGTDRRNARLAHEQTRVAARSIVTDLRGNRMLAEGRVEATLLTAEGSESGLAQNRLFVPEEAVHFVSQKMESFNGASRLVFTGVVRGWQGERNLSAERIVVDQEEHLLEASENVSTRFPRETGLPAAAAADYVQIASDRLDYDDATGLAVYTGEVTARLAEGWLESERVEVLLSAESREIREIRASGSVVLEVHSTSEDEMARPFSGTADRLVYTPAESTLVLYGDQSPAAVRRIGSGGGTTTGRVLTYHLDSGSLDVDSGGQGGRIRTGAD